MSEVIQVARLHHKTVSEHQRHIVRKARTKGIKNAVESIKVDMRVWRAAMEIAKGDSTRIVVNTPTEVVVLNRSKRK